MTLPEEKFEDDVWYVLKKIKQEALYNNSEKYIPFFSVSDWEGLTETTPDRQFSILKILEDKGTIKINPPTREAPYAECYIDIIQPDFDMFYQFHYVITDSRQTAKKLKENKPQQIQIKSLSLNEKDYFLEINNGEDFISFKSKKNKEDLEKETKQFKILYVLWESRREIIDDNPVRAGDIITLNNLVVLSGSTSKGAVLKHIQRLNIRFQKKKLKIKIEGENEKYRLVIYKTKT
jgi:hypothetical protein